MPKMDLKSSFVTRESAQALVECGARLGTCVPRTHPALRLLQTCGEHGVSSFVLLLSHGVVMSRKESMCPSGHLQEEEQVRLAAAIRR